MHHYQAPFWAFNTHLQTIIPALLRKAPQLNYQKEHFYFSDTDFTQLNWIKQNNTKLAVILPGLESNAQREYIRNTADILAKMKFDVLVPDHRSCGEQFNTFFRSYHSGNSNDLKEIIEKHHKAYQFIVLIGFSLGGNICLKYLGENKNASNIHQALCISTPLDLDYSSRLLELPKNKIYQTRFVKKLKKRLKTKALQFPELLNLEDLKKAQHIRDIDEIYTSKAHGFKDASHYYEVNSSIRFVSEITVPTTIINAQNDPMIFLREHEISLLQSNPNIQLILEKEGGHVGFPLGFFTTKNYYEKLLPQLIRAFH